MAVLNQYEKHINKILGFGESSETWESKSSRNTKTYRIWSPARLETYAEIIAYLKTERIEFNEVKGAGSSMPYIQIQKAQFKWNFYLKPTTGGQKRNIDLKPQAFGVKEDSRYSFNNYVDLVLKNMKERTDLGDETKIYLNALFQYHAGTMTKEEVVTAYTEAPILPEPEINKDFGETIGPLGILKYQLLAPIGIRLSKSMMKIWMPERPNEPLLDYMIIVGNEELKVSAKTGATKATNTVKPGDILTLLHLNKDKVAKWRNHEQYKVLSILGDHSIVDGPIFTAAHLKVPGVTKAGAESIQKYVDNYDELLFADFIVKSPYLAKLHKKPTSTEIMYECEKAVQKISETRLNFNEIFRDAIANQVVYVKFHITGSNPEGIWSMVSSEDFKSKRVIIRSKNGYTRKKDRMGIQP